MKFIIIVSTLLMSIMAHANYFRLWRGEPKKEISYAQFQDGLNSIFVPATENLKHSIARLKSYHPFLLNEAMSKSEEIPTEIALVEYESENSYKSFRTSPEGVRYGNLHWDYFNKEKSKSLVPVAFIGQEIEFESAYSFTRSSTLSFASAYTFIQIIKRTESFSDYEWKECIRGHLDFISYQNVVSVIFLATKDYYVEYTLWNSVNDKEESDRNTSKTEVDPRRGPYDVINDRLVEVGKIVVNLELKNGRL